MYIVGQGSDFKSACHKMAIYALGLALRIIASRVWENPCIYFGLIIELRTILLITSTLTKFLKCYRCAT
jgi:hypothetical protein